MYPNIMRTFQVLSLVSFLSLAACNNGMKSSSTNSTNASTSTDPGTQTPAPSPTPGPTASPSPQPMPAPGPLPAPVGANCGLQTATSAAAFCETFDKPSTIFNRSGQLDGLVWGVSRLLSESNLSLPFLWANTKLDVCGNIQTVNSPNDVQICNGQLREATNDHHNVSALAMYPKQQFDFSGRVGTVAFDVTNDSAGTHASWPEFWMSDQPVPVPFNHFGSWVSLPANGFGVRFAAYAPSGQFGLCPTAEPGPRFTVDSAVIVRDWRYEDVLWDGGSQCADQGDYGKSCVKGNTKVVIKGCVKAPNGPNGGLNHIELKVSANNIDVYASDAGTTTPLKLIATVTNANLTLSRGFIWMEDAHYNATKGPENDVNRPIQSEHTFTWDNVAFDGPLIARERSFDVLESKTPATDGLILGWKAISATEPASLMTIPIPAADLVAAKTGALLFNFYHYDAPTSITYKINGVTHVAAWPFPDTQGFTARTISLPVPLTDLVMGANSIQIYGDKGIVVTNVSISLQGAGGIVAPKLN